MKWKMLFVLMILGFGALSQFGQDGGAVDPDDPIVEESEDRDYVSDNTTSSSKDNLPPDTEESGFAKMRIQDWFLALALISGGLLLMSVFNIGYGGRRRSGK